MKRVVILFFIALLFCNEEEIYTFVNNINEGHRVKYKQDDIMTFDMPGAGEVRLGGNKTQLLEYLGKQGEFYLIRSTLSKITAINVMGDRVSSNYDSQIINNIPCLLYIDINGEVDHLEYEDEYMEDIFKKQYMTLSEINYIYPFGKNAVDLSVGDSWTKVNDSLKIFLDDGGTESLMSDSSIFTLNKIKSKKGRIIAYISSETYVKCELRMILMGELMEGVQTGTFNSSYRFDIDAGETIMDKGSGEMQGKFNFLDADFNSKTYFSNTFKRVK